MTFTQKELLMLAMRAALCAGEDIMRVYHQKHISKSIKADNSPVTEADHAAHERITEILLASGLPVLSEEGREISYEERKDWPEFWLVDPLDGTKEFIKRNGEFTVNIALVSAGTPIMGVILVPDSGILYFGGKDTGAYRIHRAHQPAGDGDISFWMNRADPLPLDANQRPFTVVASRSHINKQTAEFINNFRGKHGNIETVSRGSALKFCIVAEGVADLYPRFAPTWEWDTGAGQAIIEAAGCRMLAWPEMKPMEYNKEVLTNPWFIVEGPNARS